MPDKKKDKATLQIIFSSMLLAVIFLVELYAMINASDQFVVIGIIGVLFIACLYVLVSGIIGILDVKRQNEKEQYENIFKSEKASYLMLKKYFSEIEEKLAIIERVSKIPTEEIVGTQKGIGKVIISRSRENAEAVMASNDILMDRFDTFENAISQNNDKIISSYKSIGEENVNQLLMKQQDILMSLKDMELRLNTAIMQTQKVVATPQIVTAPMPQPMQYMPAPEMVSVSAPVIPNTVPIMEETISEDFIAEEAIAETLQDESEGENISDDEINALLEDISNVVIDEMAEPVITQDTVSELEAEPEIVSETEVKPPMPDLSDPNKMMSPDDIAALLANMGGDNSTSAAEPEVVSELVEEEKPPMPDLSDPNKMMSPDDIAALLANMGGDDSAPAEEPEPEIIPEPVVEEKPPMPDLSDPNKMMSPDDIAALLANMGGDDSAPAAEPEPAPAPAAPEIDLSDPNKKLSADEIAALFASMGN